MNSTASMVARSPAACHTGIARGAKPLPKPSSRRPVIRPRTLVGDQLCGEMGVLSAATQPYPVPASRVTPTVVRTAATVVRRHRSGEAHMAAQSDDGQQAERGRCLDQRGERHEDDSEEMQAAAGGQQATPSSPSIMASLWAPATRCSSTSGL